MSDQTNLSALKVAIKVVCAEKHDKTFAIIAENTRRLVIQTANKIDSLQVLKKKNEVAWLC